MIKGSYSAWGSFGLGHMEGLVLLLSLAYRWEIPLYMSVTLGDSTHKGLFLVMKPLSGPWVSLGQGNGCEYENSVVGRRFLLLPSSEEGRLESPVSLEPPLRVT